MKNDSLKLVLVCGHLEGSEPSTTTSPASAPVTPVSSQSVDGPVCRYVNIELCGISPCAGATGCKAMVLLENPQGDFPLTLRELVNQVMVHSLAISHLSSISLCQVYLVSMCQRKLTTWLVNVIGCLFIMQKGKHLVRISTHTPIFPLLFLPILARIGKWVSIGKYLFIICETINLLR